jgi:hypothetical protein
MNQYRRQRRPESVGRRSGFARWPAGPIGAAVVYLTLSAGCYQRVVDRDAPYETRGEVHEANVKEDERIPVVDDLEDAILGPKEHNIGQDRPD